MMGVMLGLFGMILLMASIPVSLCFPSLNSTFSHYEILTHRHIAVRVKRDASGRERRKELVLSIFGRKVSLILKPGLPESLLSPDAKIHALYGNGTISEIKLDINDFHQGVIKGRPMSWVHSFCHDGLWTIQAIDPAMSFSVEPLGFHIGLELNYHMVAYRHRDIRTEIRRGEPLFEQTIHNNRSSSLSGYPILNDNNASDNQNIRLDRVGTQNIYNKNIHYNNASEMGNRSVNTSEFKYQRKRRDSETHLVCDILAIADYTFYQGFGAESNLKTAKILIDVYVTANSVFSKTRFEAKKKVSLRLTGIKVYSQKTDPLGFEEVVEGNKKYIRLMTDEQHYDKQCLVHISTQRYFKGDALSSAHTARLVDDLNGICGTHQNLSGNVGYSTVIHKKSVLPLTSYKLVVSHELGHNFGANHDGVEGTSQPECMPSDEQGGKYVMWRNSLAGFKSNNYKFSPCSIHSINKILKKRSNCLAPENIIDHITCGNGILDYGEDCDAGKLLQDNLQDNLCCTPKCRFTPRAICSPFNHPCCKNCTVAPATHRCVNKIDYSCSEESFCDGVDFHSCPPSSAKPNGYRCVNHGECHSGMCIDYCSIVGQRRNPPEPLQRCNCESADTRCNICCKRLEADQSCFSTRQVYDDDMPCEFGFCKNGTCRESGPLDEDEWFTSKFEMAVTKKNDFKIALYIIVGTLVGFLIICLFTALIFDDVTVGLLSAH